MAYPPTFCGWDPSQLKRDKIMSDLNDKNVEQTTPADSAVDSTPSDKAPSDKAPSEFITQLKSDAKEVGQGLGRIGIASVFCTRVIVKDVGIKAVATTLEVGGLLAQDVMQVIGTDNMGESKVVAKAIHDTIASVWNNSMDMFK
jgi:hypothetical protein